MSRTSNIASAVAIALALGSTASQAAQRAFVASYGSDTNTGSGCLIANPCRTFTAGVTAVDAGGEVIALDTAGYGAVTITKSVTLTTNPGYFAGIAASTGNAVTIATAGVNVILRGLNINGIGATDGVNMTNGTSLTVENCVITNFTNSGVFVAAGAVRIADTVLRGNGVDGAFIVSGATGTLVNVKASSNARAGLVAQDLTDGTATVVGISDSDLSGNAFGAVSWSTTATGSARVTVARSTISHNPGNGLYTVHGGGTNATAIIGGSAVYGNGGGLVNSGAGLESQGNNLVRGNGSNTGGVITNVGSL